ncbi:MAG: phosphoribosylanthranilate isomerase, partial [Candidatus Methanomethylophilaceae archaeon]|nr:phosphoribosylanthranilate isomerase [Candidatus Methanomethylophilaceae archaeon]
CELRKKTGKQIIKAFKITCEKDVLEAMNSKADLILLDGGSGEGKSFDWSLLKSIKRDFILAGGLTPNNVKSAVETIQPYAVDTSSGVETEQFKDEQKISDFIRAVRTAGSD